MKVAWRFLVILSVSLVTMNMLYGMEEEHCTQQDAPKGVVRSARVVPLDDSGEIPKEKGKAPSDSGHGLAVHDETIQQRPESSMKKRRCEVVGREPKRLLLKMGVRSVSVRKAWEDEADCACADDIPSGGARKALEDGAGCAHGDSRIPRCIPECFRAHARIYNNGEAGSSNRKFTIYTIAESEHQVQDPLDLHITKHQDFSDDRYEEGETRLHDAILHNKMRKVNRILRDAELRKDLLDQYDRWGRTPLMLAAFKGNLEIARCLAEAGAHANMYDEDGRTVLHIAAEFGDAAMVEFLLTLSDLPVNRQDRFGLTALHIACMFNNGNEEIVQKLLLHPDIEVNILDYRRLDCQCRCTALDYACYPELTWYGKRNDDAYQPINDECFSETYKINRKHCCFCCCPWEHSQRQPQCPSYADFLHESAITRELLENKGARHGTVCDSCFLCDHSDVIRARAQKIAKQTVAETIHEEEGSPEVEESIVETLISEQMEPLSKRLKRGPRKTYLWLY